MAAPPAEPRPPCDGVTSTIPPYADPGGSPSIRVWSGPGASQWAPPACVGWPAQQRFRTIVAIAGQFRHDGDAESLLARGGAISRLRGLLYWSMTDQAWRVLVTDACALDSADPAWRRPDFNPDEMKVGAELFFAQGERRLKELVVYRLRVLERAPERVVLETANASAVRALFVTLFPPGCLRATWFLERREPGVWSVYGLAGTGENASLLAPHHEASYVNRAAALYGYLVGASGGASGKGS